jgi:hypothetical protein
VRRIAALGLWLAAAHGCGDAKDQSHDTVAAAPHAAAAAPRADSPTAKPQGTTAPANPNATACVSEGAWQTCSVEKRLTDAGFVLVNKGAAPTGVFDVSGTKYVLGAAELDVYVFASEKERSAAVAGIDTVTVSKSGGASPWSMPPTLITSNNLVAVLLSDNGRLIERVQLAITAGLPSAQH